MLFLLKNELVSFTNVNDLKKLTDNSRVVLLYSSFISGHFFCGAAFNNIPHCTMRQISIECKIKCFQSANIYESSDTGTVELIAIANAYVLLHPTLSLYLADRLNSMYVPPHITIWMLISLARWTTTLMMMMVNRRRRRRRTGLIQINQTERAVQRIPILAYLFYKVGIYGLIHVNTYLPPTWINKLMTCCLHRERRNESLSYKSWLN